MAKREINKGYNDFLKSKKWKDIRKKLFQTRGSKCEVCGSTKLLHVHHKTYARFGGDEKLDDLQILCEKHHNAVHKGSRKMKFNFKLKRWRRFIGCSGRIHKFYAFDRNKIKNFLDLANLLSSFLKHDKVFTDFSKAEKYVIEEVKRMNLEKREKEKQIELQKIEAATFKPKYVLRKRSKK